MATIHEQIEVDAPVEKVWTSLRQVGEAHKLFAPVLTGGTLDGDIRTVTFANGMVARERIVDIDDSARRVAWAAVGGRMSHHNASAQVFAEGAGGSRVVWIADLLPNEIAPVIATMIEQGTAAMKRTLEGAAVHA